LTDAAAAAAAADDDDAADRARGNGELVIVRNNYLMSRDDVWYAIVSLATSVEYKRVNMHYSLLLYNSQITKRFPKWTRVMGFPSTLQGNADCKGKLMYCYLYERQASILPMHKLKISTFPVACSERVYYSSALRMGSSNLPFATKT
jgi:hypothetical protein